MSDEQTEDWDKVYIANGARLVLPSREPRFVPITSTTGWSHYVDEMDHWGPWSDLQVETPKLKRMRERTPT